ncbi:MAG: hypothetical protein WA182_12065 [Candidatus Sulfotelmatobacter sp.]
MLRPENIVLQEGGDDATGLFCEHLDPWVIKEEDQIVLCESCADAREKGAMIQFGRKIITPDNEEKVFTYKRETNPTAQAQMLLRKPKTAKAGKQ